MLNLEQVPFNIIEKRMQKPRMLGEREHLCHCYACCLVTTAFSARRTEAAHGESLPLQKKRRKEEFHISQQPLKEMFHFGICPFLCGLQLKLLLTTNLSWMRFTVWGITHKLLCLDLPKKKWNAVIVICTVSSSTVLLFQMCKLSRETALPAKPIFRFSYWVSCTWNTFIFIWWGQKNYELW